MKRLPAQVARSVESRKPQRCVDCHFFTQEDRAFKPPRGVEVAKADRDKARRGDYSWVHERFVLTCSFDVWDEGYNFDKSQRQEVIVETDRRDFCFFWRFRPGMLLPAARTLQAREAEAKDSKRDRRLTIWGLWIAALALLIDVALRVFDRFSQIGGAG